MKILLIFPRYKYQNFAAEPLSIFYLASVLREKEYDFELIDGTTQTIEETIKEIEKIKPDVLALSIHTVFANYASQLAMEFKNINPEGVVIAGGPHPTVLPEETLREFVDFVIIGEGEETLPELLKNLNSPKKIRGIAYKENGKVKFTKPRKPIKDLDKIPFPARDLMDDRYYEIGSITLMSSRGCPFNCSFCQPTLRKLFGLKFRQRSPENVLAEVEYAAGIFRKKGYEFKRFAFTDDGITYNKEWLVKFCSLLIKRGNKIPWEGDSRADTLPDNKILKLMKKAGCRRISIGIESGDDYIRNKILGKGLSREKIIDAFRRCHEVGIEPHSFLMVGSPGETKASIWNTVKLLDEAKPATTQVTVTTPLPGTRLYNYCREKGILDIKKWSDYDYYVKSHIKLKNFTNAQIKNLRAAIKFSILGRRFFKRYLGLSIKYSTLFRFFMLPFVTPFFRQLEWGRLSGLRKNMQYLLNINLSGI